MKWHDDTETCEWCEAREVVTQSEHRRFIKTLEDNLNALRAELHVERVKNQRLKYELDLAKGRAV